MIRWLLAGAAVAAILLFSITGAFFGLSPPEAALGTAPSSAASADIPPQYLVLCQATAENSKPPLDWAILCAITWRETNHGRSNAVGVTSGQNSAGAKGPCQFLQGTWDLPGIGNGGDIYDPADCIPAMARYLIKGGAPDDWHGAIFAYNHAEWYVQQVLARAELYRGTITEMSPSMVGGIRARIVELAKQTLTSRTGYHRYLQNPILTDDPMPPPPARTDCSQWVRAIYLLAGAPDPGTTTWDQIGRGHQVVNPQPGDLLFTPNEDHVELYVGNGRTIGHGTPTIDYADVSDFPHHFFMTYPGVE